MGDIVSRVGIAQSGVSRHLRILQGAEDPDVPWQHAFALAHRLPAEDVVLTMIQDGDHRLSRETDVALLIDTVARTATQ